MKPSWVLSEDERQRRFRKNRERGQPVEPSGSGQPEARHPSQKREKSAKISSQKSAKKRKEKNTDKKSAKKSAHKKCQKKGTQKIAENSALKSAKNSKLLFKVH